MAYFILFFSIIEVRDKIEIKFFLNINQNFMIIYNLLFN